MRTYVKRGRPAVDVEARFWAKVDRSGECWLWTAASDKHGRTKFSCKGRVEPANRVAWLLVRGSLPTHTLRNLCGNSLCVRPDHWGKPKHNKRPLTPAQHRARWEQRFKARISKEVHVPEMGPCWIWQGYRDPNGYGRVSYQGQSEYAHRVAYLVWGGEIPDGHEIDHLCRVRGCCNPKHLEPVPHQVNCARSPIHVFFHPELRSTFNQPATHCKRGHALTPDNRYSGGRGRCATCARQYAAETAARKKDDPEYQERYRAQRRARYAHKRTDPGFRERENERNRALYLRKKQEDPNFLERERERSRARSARQKAMSEVG